MININGDLLDLLNADQYYLLSILQNYGDKSCPKNDVLAFRTKWGINKVQATKRSLIKLGLIESKKRFKIENGKSVRDSNEYVIKTNLCSKYSGEKSINNIHLIQFHVDENEVHEIEVHESELHQNEVGNNILKLLSIENFKVLKDLIEEKEIKERESNQLKNQDAKEKKKDCAKKEKTPHVFPDISPRKSYKVQQDDEDEQERDPRDMRTNPHLPFSKFKSEAIETLRAIYPEDNYQLLIDCQQMNNGLHPTNEQLALCRDSYIKAGLDQYSYLTVMTDINLFQENFLKWIPKHLKFMKRGKEIESRKTYKKNNPDTKHGFDVNYSEQKSSEMAQKYG